MKGQVALVGGAEFRPAVRELDAWLLERSGAKTVTVVAAATVPEGRPDLAIATARAHFEALGAAVEDAMVLDRGNAEDEARALTLAQSRFIYLAGGDPSYLAETFRGTRAWEAIVEANEEGAVLAGSSAGAMVLCDRMLPPGVNEPTAALGLIGGVLVVPHARSGGLQERGVVSGRILAIEESTGLIVDGPTCRVLGAGSVSLWANRKMLWAIRSPGEMPRCLEEDG